MIFQVSPDSVWKHKEMLWDLQPTQGFFSSFTVERTLYPLHALL